MPKVTTGTEVTWKCLDLQINIFLYILNVLISVCMCKCKCICSYTSVVDVMLISNHEELLISSYSGSTIFCIIKLQIIYDDL